MVQRLIELDRFTSFSVNMVSDAPSRFKDWFNALNPETENLPLEWKALKDSPF